VGSGAFGGWAAPPVMPLLCPCYASAMPLPCPCHAPAMPLPRVPLLCPCYASAMPLPRVPSTSGMGKARAAPIERWPSRSEPSSSRRCVVTGLRQGQPCRARAAPHHLGRPRRCAATSRLRRSRWRPPTPTPPSPRSRPSRTRRRARHPQTQRPRVARCTLAPRYLAGSRAEHVPSMRLEERLGAPRAT
jgi:hypothetical protein